MYRLVRLLDRLGLAGERANGCIVYLVLTSRIQDRPISLTVRGESSAGKPYTVMVMLILFPPEAFMALTGLSKQALIYSDEPLSHRTVVIFERPGAAAADYNIRTLQSEGKIVFDTVERDPSTNRQRTVRVAKEGRTNFVFTTTAPEIHPETETRHLSIFGDESREQTAAAKKKGAAEYLEPLIPHEKYEEEVAIWTTAQSLLQPARVVIPYAEWLADRTPDTPVRMRRDFQRLLAFIETVSLFHQEQRVKWETEGARVVQAGLEDYYIAHALVGGTFIANSQGLSQRAAQLAEAVGHLRSRKLDGEGGPASVTVAELARYLDTTDSTVRRWLKPAVNHGWVEEVEEARGSKGGRYAPGKAMPDHSPLPSVEELAEAFPELVQGFSVIDPITGEKLELRTEGIKVRE